MGGRPTVSALSPGGTTQRAAPPGLGPGFWGLQLLAESKTGRGPSSTLARLRLQPRPSGCWCPNSV
eukprot:6236950-Alexandrium_andersonii.AAC.1